MLRGLIASQLINAQARATLPWAAAALALLALLVSGPWSPFALDRVDAAMARGSAAQALDASERVSTLGLTPAIRLGARYRAALILGPELGRHQEAVEQLEEILRSRPGERLRESSLLLLADTLDAHLGELADAAARYEELADMYGDTPIGAEWRLVAAETWERHGDLAQASALRRIVAASDGPWQSEAWLAMGRASLGSGDPALAYDNYLLALGVDGARPENKRLARLGMALALDALGEVSQAVAELDEGEEGGDEAISITRQRLVRRAEEAHRR